MSRSGRSRSDRKRAWQTYFKINRLLIRVFACLAILLCVVAPIVYAVVEYRQKQFHATLLRLSVQAETQGDLAKANRYLSQYLSFRPDDFEARSRLARILARRANTTEDRKHALAILKAVLEVAPGRTEERRLIADLSMALGMYGDAINHLEELRKSAPADGELQDLIGQCYEAEQHYDQAAEHYEKAVALAPKLAGASVRYAVLLRRHRDDPGRADQVIDRLVAAQGKTAGAYLERCRYRRAFHLAGTADDIARARSLAPEDPEVLMEAVAVGGLTSDKPALAAFQKDLGRALERHPADTRLYLVLAGLEIQRGRIAEAEASLRLGIKKADDPKLLNWRLANLLLDLNKPDEAARVVEDLRNAGVRSQLLDFLGGRLQMSRGRWAEAARSLESARAGLVFEPVSGAGSADIDLLLGRCYEQLGDDERRTNAYRRAFDAEPDSAAAGEQLAGTLAATGKVREAVALYRKLAVGQPRFLVNVARLLLDQAFRVSPSQRAWGQVEQAIEETGRALPGSPVVPLLVAEMRVARGQIEAARDGLVKARDQHPDRVDLWIALADVSGRLGKPGDVLAVLDAAEKQLGDRVELRLARAGYAASRQPETAPKVLAGLEDHLERLPEADRPILLRGLATARVWLGDNAEARRLWSRLIAVDPSNLSARLGLFDTAVRADDEPAMKAALAEVRRIEGEGGPWGSLDEIRLALWQARHGDKAALERARVLGEGLKALRPSWAVLAVAQAEAEELAGHWNEAAVHYQRAIALGANDPDLIRRAVELLHAGHRYEEAARLMATLRDKGPLSADLRRLSDDLALRTNDPAQALESAQKVVESGSRNARDYFWLGQVLWIAGKNSQVEPVLRKAVALDKNDAAAWVALVDYLSRTGQLDRARAAALEAKATLSNDKEPLALARCDELAGNRDEARGLYASALAARPKDPVTLRAAAAFDLRDGRLADAERLLRGLVALKTAPADDTDWARQNLALLLSTGTDYPRFQEALALLGGVEGLDSAQAGETPAAARRVKAIVLSREPGRPHRKEAIRILEDLVEHPPVLPGDEFLLAQLYEQDGSLPKALERLSSLLVSSPRNPGYLAFMARALLQRGDTESARALVERLKAVAPTTPETVELDARTLKAEGKRNAAATLLKTFAQDKDGAVTAKVGTLLEEVGDLAAAEAMYRLAISRSKPPAGELIMARFLARRGVPIKALDLCEGAWKQGSPEDVAATCQYILIQSKADEVQRARVSRWLETALREHPQSTTLVLDLALLRELQGRYSDAETLYRQVLTRDRNHSIASNNLAWLLAFQPGRGAEALALSNRAVAVVGPQADLLDTRGVIHMALGQYREALDDLQKSLAAATIASTYFHISQIYVALNQHPEAVSAFQKATAAGLTVDTVHPLEQKAYAALVGQLATH